MTKKSILIPDEVYKEIKMQTDNFNFFVIEAIKELLPKKQIEKGLNSFGKWEHREQESRDSVNERREDRTRNYANSID